MLVVNAPDQTYVQANTNGRLHPANEPSLSPLNRGFLYGDAVYEVWRTYDRVVFAWAEHWQRLERSAGALKINLPGSADEIWRQVKATITAFDECTGRGDDLFIRLQVYRGEGTIGLDIKLATPPGFVILVKSVPTLSPQVKAAGLRLTIAQGIRRNPIAALDPAWKTGNYLNNLMGLEEAHRRSADDVLFLNHAGELTESSTSNVAFIRGDEWTTPALASGILHGITRARIVSEVARRVGLKPIERVLSPDEMGSFDEAMLLSTTKDVQPVGSIDDHRYDVTPTARLWRLKAAFAEHAQREGASHPERRVS